MQAKTNWERKIAMRNRFVLVGFCLLFLSGCSDDILTIETPSGPTGEPSAIDLGLRLVPAGTTLNLEGLSQSEINQIALGSYLVNGAGACFGCHSSQAGYMAGGNEFQLGFLPPDVQGRTLVITRNLTPDPETGMKLTEAEFIESI
jgi:mono/diheme cytochrome c family protein